MDIKKLDPNAKIPAYAHEDDAGMDIFSLETVTIGPGQRVAARTGIAAKFPAGYVALVWDKSGVAMNRGIKVLGGVIDAGYRGEYLIGLQNLGSEPQTFSAGDKLAQVLIQKVEHPIIVEVEDLDDTARGDKGFGSTGV